MAVIQNKKEIAKFSNKKQKAFFELKSASPQRVLVSGDVGVLPRYFSDFLNLAKQVISCPGPRVVLMVLFTTIESRLKRVEASPLAEHE